jgi:hypothetical protein
MGRLKSFEKRKAREREKKNALGVSIPLICAGEDCEAQTQLGLFEPAPFAAALFRQSGWFTLSDDSDGIVRFYCPNCKDDALAELEIQPLKE